MALVLDPLADAVTLAADAPNTEATSGFVDVGAFTVRVATDDQGNLTVEAYPLGDTSSLLTVFTLGKQVATLAAAAQPALQKDATL